MKLIDDDNARLPQTRNGQRNLSAGMSAPGGGGELALVGPAGVDETKETGRQTAAAPGGRKAGKADAGRPAGSGKTRALVTLFLSAALVVGTAGCGNSSSNRDCRDDNQDGYCDDGSGGRSMYYYGGSGGSSARTGSGTVTDGGSSSVSGKSSNGVSSGSHGGIGSSSGSSSS